MSREDAIEARRQAIFDAAGRLIRKNRSTDFTMPTLAKSADLSNATTYNIIGGKSTVLYHLLDSCVEDLLAVARQNHDRGIALDQVMRSADAAIDHFARDPDLYRPLMQHLLGANETANRPSFMSKALRYWRISLGQLNSDGACETSAKAEDLAQIIHTLFVGAMNSWIYGDLDSDGMRGVVRRGIELVLAGATNRAN